MEIITLQSEVFQSIMNKLNAIESKMEKLGSRRPRLEDEYIDSTEVCQLLKVSRKTLERYRDVGKIPFVKIKRRVYYRLRDLEEFMMNNSYKSIKGIL